MLQTVLWLDKNVGLLVQLHSCAVRTSLLHLLEYAGLSGREVLQCCCVVLCLQVLLRGDPDWESCLSVVNTVVNASAPCAVHEHLPACVLGTPQPELQGNFVALTGKNSFVLLQLLLCQDMFMLCFCYLAQHTAAHARQ